MHDFTFKPPQDPASPEGPAPKKYKQIERPQIDATVKKLEHEHKPGGSPTAHCAECGKRCEDCIQNCVGTGIEWRYE